ncbi:ribonuclease III [Cyanobium sp. Morenito 9A2]|uniref:ribonuclease III n=1 Tax=Cyanobium sp. Morenito 9A2 TaxID=2823718 RepID=UPI0020CF72C7|nr:ribonuclease III [Cyanobium sp. Morenito 9A2]MCP9849525.1 ribonuclease III [Cyanobium sp. Morenito 9A2]
MPIPNERRQQLVAFLASLGLEEAPDLAPIDEALTHTSASRSRNHERLEFLGDAVLRLAAAEHLQHQHPQLGVGACSALRAQLVSDRALAELGAACGIDAVLLQAEATRLDPLAAPTVRAECTEALIGGLYEAWGNLLPIHRWLSPHWQRATAELLADPHRHNWKQALQEWSQGKGLGLPSYALEERHRSHGHPERFHSRVELAGKPLGEGSGRSRREAEQRAARRALEALEAQLPSD